jgi:photosystem II stability/assembly factor-like uncharacterized protein
VAVSSALAAAALLALPAGAGATTWSQVPSGTTSTITAIEYQSPSRFWFTTANGEIFGKEAGGNFSLQKAATGIPLNDIEFLPSPSEVGLAVGNAGQVFRTINGGLSWLAVTGIPVSKSASESTFPDCSSSAPLGDVNAVRFAGPLTVWIMAEGSQLAFSGGTVPVMAGEPGSWSDANRDTDNTCTISDSYAEGFGDAFFVPANPRVGYFCVGSFHEVFFTADNLATDATKRPASCGNGSGDDLRLAGDPADPNRMWAVDAGPYGVSMTARTADGWSSSSPFTLVNIEARSFSEATDVDYSGGTVLVSGGAGMILGSKDGDNFYFTDAAAPLASTRWEAASLAGPDDGAVGGQGGALAVTADASAVTPVQRGQQPKDTTPPETSLLKKPKKRSAKRKVKFVFVSSEAGSTFECKIDRVKRYSACRSPLKKKMRPGKHSFSVRAVDPAGNRDATPAIWSFKIKAPHRRH